MISIIIVLIFISCLTGYLLDPYKSSKENWGFATIFAGIFMAFSLLIIPLLYQDGLSSINDYQKQKEIYLLMNLNNLTELRKAALLQSLLNADKEIRKLKWANSKWLLDLYVPDKVESIQLLRFDENHKEREK